MTPPSSFELGVEPGDHVRGSDVGTVPASDDAAEPQGSEQPMSKVSMMGTITCQPGKEDEMTAVLTKMVEAARDEPGVEIYSYHRGDGATFSFFALMSNAEAMQGHGQSPAMQAAMQEFMPLMAEPPQMSATAPIAAVGFDL